MMSAIQEHVARQITKLNSFSVAAGGERFDANETAFLAAELVQQRSKLYEVQYADNMALSFVPLATDIDAEAPSYSTHVLDKAGRAKAIGGNVTDIPRVDVKIDEILGKIVDLGVSFGFGLSELRTAAKLGRPLEMWKGRAARSAIDDEIDQMLATGETTTQTGLGVTGLLNNASVSVDTTSFTVWAGADASDALIAELNKPASAVNVTVKSKGSLLPDTLLIAPVMYDIIATKPMGSGSDLTVLGFFLKNNPYIKNVVQWNKLATANAAGNGPRSILYRRSPDILEGVVPITFEQLPPQTQGLEIVTNCRARAGGVKIYQPAAMLYIDHTG